MSGLVEVETLEGLDFKWGKQRGDRGKNKDVRFYETFTYDGMDYALNDCVFMDNKDEPPHIGKLVEIWENSDKTKKVKVQWFFRPWEISSLLGDVEMMENELLFASGVGTGLTDINPLEVVAGKCNVVCISKDSRNLQPSAEEVQMADYIFYRTFDVNSNTISDQMGDTVGGLDVKHVFNSTESLRALDDCNLTLTGKDVIACGETQEARGKNSLLQLEVLEPNEDLMLGKEGTNVNEMHAKHGGLLGEGSSGGNVNSSKNGKIKGIILEKKNFPIDKNVSEKDKLKDIKSRVSWGRVEEGVKISERDVGDDFDCNTLSKKAKLDGPVSSLEFKNVKRAQSLTSSGKATSELDKNLDGSGKDVNLDGKSSFLDDNFSKTSVPPRKKPRFGHAEDLSALQGKQSKGNDFLSREMSKVTHAKDYVGAEKGKKVGENWGASMKMPSKINLVSPSVAKMLVTPNRTTFSLKSGMDLSKDKSNIRKMADYENMNKLADDSRPLESSLTKKGKLDDTINRVSKKSPSNEVNNSSSHVVNDYTTKSKHGKGVLKEHLEGGPSKKGKFDDTYCKNNGNRSNGNVREKTCLSETKNLLKDAAHENMAKSKLGKGASKGNFDDKFGKAFKNNSPTPSIVKSNNDDGKVERRIFEVTRRPVVEKSNWMKLPWENKMKTAHDQGRLVLLQNLDPEYTSGEVEDIVWHAFKDESTAKMVQQTAMSNPYSGQAFVIFKSREAVDRVVKKLEGGCLMLPNRRLLVVSKIDFPKFLEKQTFAGHLAIDKARRRWDPMRSFSLSNEAVSTSHYSKSNTIEYEMAMAWCLLQSKFDSWWTKLYKQQTKEITKLADNLKLK